MKIHEFVIAKQIKLKEKNVKAILQVRGPIPITGVKFSIMNAKFDSSNQMRQKKAKL